VLVSATTLIAGPARRGDFPAEPAYAVHLNCDAMRGSTLGDLINAELSKPEAENKFTSFKAMFNFDPRTALHAVSVYGMETKPDAGLLIVYADFDPARLEALVKGAKEYQSSSHRSRTIHSWIDESKKSAEGAGRRVYGAIAGGRVLFAQSQERLAGALDVIDGFSANLSSSKTFPTLGAEHPGTFLQMVGRKLEVAGGDPNAALLRLSQGMTIEVAEAGGNITANISLLAKDEEVAGHMNAIGQGLMALMKLNTSKPDQVKIAEHLVLKQDGASMAGTFSMPTAEVIDMLKQAAAAKAAAK
jgi:hypothetical protein